MRGISLIIPARDEESAAEPVLQEVRRWCASHPELRTEIIVVDDGSTDRTAEILRSYDGQIKVVSHVCSRGYGAAIKSGVLHAENDWLAILDMDATYRASDLDLLCEAARKGSCDMVSGARLDGGDSGMPGLRRLGNRLYNLLLSSLYRRRVHDACTGLRLVKRSVLNSWRDLLPNDLSYALALTVLFLAKRMPFAEVGVSYGERLGSSKLNPIVDGPRFLMRIVRHSLVA